MTRFCKRPVSYTRRLILASMPLVPLLVQGSEREAGALTGTGGAGACAVLRAGAGPEGFLAGGLGPASMEGWVFGSLLLAALAGCAWFLHAQRQARLREGGETQRALTEMNERLTQETTERRRAEKALWEREEHLRHAQKMEAVGRLAGGIAHDFNNQLAVMKGYLDLLIEPLPEDAPLRNDLLMIHKAVQRSISLTEKLLLFSSKQKMDLRPTSLNRLLEDLLKMLERLLGEDIAITLDLEEGLWGVKVDPGNLDQAITNLSINARDAMPGGGGLSFQTRNVVIDALYCAQFPEARTGRFVRLSVEDTGTGMDDEVRARLFEPFFTTKGPGKGTGLGLPMVYGIVQAHTGWITVNSRRGYGSRFDIYFPALDRESHEVEAEYRPPSLSRFQGGRRRILLVEDEPMVREMTEWALTQKGYVVRSCGTIAEAWEAFRGADPRFDLILSDVILPDGWGPDLVLQLVKEQPGLGALLMTGYADERADLEGIKRAGLDILLKPVPVDKLLKRVGETIEKKESS